VRLTRSSHQIGGLIKSGLIKICRPEQSEGSGYLLATVMHVPGKDDFQAVMGGMEFKEGCSTYPCSETAGQWLDTRNRYLGLQFVIKGQVHYGWARLTVIFPPQPSRGILATLTGYAYETIPNKPIITGKTKGPDVITLDPATLGTTIGKARDIELHIR